MSSQRVRFKKATRSFWVASLAEDGKSVRWDWIGEGDLCPTCT